MYWGTPCRACSNRWDQELSSALQTDYGELADRDVPSPRRVRSNQSLGECRVDKLRNAPLLKLGRQQALGLDELHVQRYRIDGLYDAGREIIRPRYRRYCIGRKALDAPAPAEEHNALVEYRKSGYGLRVGEGLAGDLVEIGAFNRVVASVEGYRLHIYLNVQQLGGFRAHTQSILYVGLRGDGRKHPEVVNTILVAAAVKYLIGINAYGFADACRALYRPRHNSVGHR